MNTKTAEDSMDKHIHEHLHKFGENSLFRASLDHFREHGKPSGSFRASLRAMLYEHATQECTPLKKRIEELEDMLRSTIGYFELGADSKQKIREIRELLNPSTNGK